MELARQHVDHLLNRIRSLGGKVEHLREWREKHQHKAGRFVGGLVGTGEVVAGALLGGAIDGRWGSKEKGLPMIANIPVTLGLGLLFNVAGHANLAGNEWSHHICNIGNGVLGSYFSNVGFHYGRRVKASGHWFFPTKKVNAAVSGQVHQDQMASVASRLAQARAAAAGGGGDF
jgi:hypothetical protein